MPIILYDLCGADGRRFSPNCWRTRMALEHKGIPYEARATRFTEIQTEPDGRRRTLPTIEDGGRVVTGSWAIAEHLEHAYPDRPSLFGGPAGRALSRFFDAWADTVLHPGIAAMVVKDIHAHLAPEDQAYFRETRERRFGKALEAVQDGREGMVEPFRRSLAPLRRTLESQPFLGGGAPLYADYLAFGAFMWARTISPFRLLAADDPIVPWIERCLDLYDGLARKQPGYHWPAA